MTLSEAQKKYLRGLGHKLKPVVMIGDAGLSESVTKEFELAITHHELIKVSVRAGDRGVRGEIIEQLCADGTTGLVQRIGNMALLYRENPEKQKRSDCPTADRGGLDVLNRNYLVFLFATWRGKFNGIAFVLANQGTCNWRRKRNESLFYIGFVFPNNSVDDLLVG